MSKTDCIGLWNHCLAFIKDNVSEQAYKTWFLPIVPLRYEDNTLQVQVPSQFFYEYLEAQYVELLRKTLYKVIGEGTNLMYKVTVVKDAYDERTVDLESSRRTIIPQKSRQTKEVPTLPGGEQDSYLNPEYNFDTFIEGESNRLSRSVAQAVAEKPAKTAFNPLFIYGASGVGKTHLSNAIGTKIKELYPSMRVLYVSAHLFQVQYTDSVRNNTTNDFINFYRSMDTLIIDDVQELAGAAKTQNTFFHIFNNFHQNGKQLVLTSDRSPMQLQGMEDRLITRFKWGMVAELERPTVALRKDILRSRVRRNGLQFPDDVIDYVAEHVGDSIRDLEGIVISIMAHSTIYNREIDLALARQIVDKVTQTEHKPVSADDIMEVVCKHYGVDGEALRGKTRKRDVVRARQVAMYLAKNNTELTASKIGLLIGNRDHATVLHALRTVGDQLQVDKSFRAELEELQDCIRRR